MDEYLGADGALSLLAEAGSLASVDSTTALEMRGITKHFGNLEALSSVTFSLRRGTLHALLGENGAGKTTLMRIAFGMISPDAGDIHIRGMPARIHSPRDEGISARRGFIAIAIVVLGRWHPVGVAIAALIFGAASALQYLFQSMGWNVPYQLFPALPYLLTLLGLARVAGRVNAPASLGKWVESN